MDISAEAIDKMLTVANEDKSGNIKFEEYCDNIIEGIHPTLL